MVAEDDDEASKTEEPSERKISKAKEEGPLSRRQKFSDAAGHALRHLAFTADSDEMVLSALSPFH